MRNKSLPAFFGCSSTVNKHDCQIPLLWSIRLGHRPVYIDAHSNSNASLRQRRKGWLAGKAGRCREGHSSGTRSKALAAAPAKSQNTSI
jgi:hypothetical protein